MKKFRILKLIWLLFLLNFSMLFNVESVFSQYNYFKGQVFLEDKTHKAIESVQVSIMSGELIKTMNTSLAGNFQFLLDENLKPPDWLLCYKAGYYTRIFNLSSHRSNEFNLKIASYNTEYTTNLYGKLIDKSNNNPISEVSVYADFGEIPTVTDVNGLFKIQVHHPNRSADILLWFYHKKYQPMVLSVSDPLTYQIKDKKLTIAMEPLPNSYNFNFLVRRKDNHEPIKDVRVEIDNVLADFTDEKGSLNIYKTFDRFKESVNVKFLHPLFADTLLSIALFSNVIGKTIDLDLQKFRINTLVYFEIGQNMIKGVPETQLVLNGKNIGFTNSIGYGKFRFDAIPGDKLFIKLPEGQGYLPPDTTIVLNKDQKNLNIKVKKTATQLEIVPVEATTGQQIPEIDSIKIIVESQMIAAEKIGNRFVVLTNLFDANNDLDAIIFSKNFHTKPDSIELERNGPLVYTGRLYIDRIEPIIIKEQPKALSDGVLILSSDPEGARITIDEQEADLTPDTLKLSPGKHSIWLNKEDYVPKSIIVDIQSDSVIESKLKLDGPITPIQKMSNWKIALEFGNVNFLMRFPTGSVALFPSFRVGGHFYPMLKSNFGIKLSYFASKVPDYFTNQEFNLGIFLRTNHFHWLVGFRESNFESFKNIKARFAGSTGESYIAMNLFSENRAKERLLFLNCYSHAIVAGFEHSFKPINKSVAGDFEREREFYLGYKLRYKRGMFDFRLGFLSPKLTVIDIEKSPHKVIDINVSRLFITYHYFLN